MPSTRPGAMRIEFCGEWWRAEPGRSFTIGRDADLVIDDHAELEDRMLELVERDGIWWLANAASSRVVQVADPGGRVAADLAPGDRVPVVFSPAHAVFVVGRTTFELSLHGDLPYTAVATSAESQRPGRIDLPRLTANQRMLLAVLCEAALRDPARRAEFPGSAVAARRLGWSLTAFNRKLDNVCDRLDRAGIAGLRGGRGNLATGRRARLVEVAVTMGLVTVDDLALLPAEA